ncbi:MAG TPA: hypothetical protein VF526_04355 [Solirubrobacteraceae bacterium]
MQPRQIYASTLNRRDRRWTRRRGPSTVSLVLVTVVTMVVAFSVLAAFASALS